VGIAAGAGACTDMAGALAPLSGASGVAPRPTVRLIASMNAMAEFYTSTVRKPLRVKAGDMVFMSGPEPAQARRGVAETARSEPRTSVDRGAGRSTVTVTARHRVP